MPVYNGELYVRQALDSLLTQDFEDFELIISDNASTDGTSDICREYSTKDRRIRYYRNKTNVGARANYRRVFELARGDYFKWHAHDDVCHRYLLSRCVHAFAKSPPSVILVYPCYEVINALGEVVDRTVDHVGCDSPRASRRLGRVIRNLSRAAPLWGLLRTELLRKTQLMGPVQYCDQLLLVELSLFGVILEIPEVLYWHRSHPGNSYAIAANQQAPAAMRAGLTNPDKVSRATRERLRAWIDPSLPPKSFWLRVQEERICLILQRVWRAPLPPAEKALCSLIVPLMSYWREFRKWSGAVRAKVRALRATS